VTLIKYLGASNISGKDFGIITKPRGQNVLEGGMPFYSVYSCKEGHVAVGNLEPKFYAEMVRGLDLTEEERTFCEGGQFTEEQDQLRSLLTRKFMEKTAKEWESHFNSYDTCITEIKSPFVDATR
jgi:alpha-methylacyl-CoA racemase